MGLPPSLTPEGRPLPPQRNHEQHAQDAALDECLDVIADQVSAELEDDGRMDIEGYLVFGHVAYSLSFRKTRMASVPMVAVMLFLRASSVYCGSGLKITRARCVTSGEL